ncbi:hypothetical protein NDI45_12740 [Leptolyngbya sp. GB1-A1]|uniref:hypothetical protein n=1 Tax=Leptolyngbya sp. GB1-A1 TaxID=2933908 RepID=UPI0032998032
MMSQTRISSDVWELGRQIAEAKGLKNERQAIEAVVRVYARHYLQGMQSIDSPAVPLAAQPASAQDALSSVLSSL